LAFNPVYKDILFTSNLEYFRLFRFSNYNYKIENLYNSALIDKFVRSTEWNENGTLIVTLPYFDHNFYVQEFDGNNMTGTHIKISLN
jgi:hypothetical protein